MLLASVNTPPLKSRRKEPPSHKTPHYRGSFSHRGTALINCNRSRCPIERQCCQEEKRAKLKEALFPMYTIGVGGERSLFSSDPPKGSPYQCVADEQTMEGEFSDEQLFLSFGLLLIIWRAPSSYSLLRSVLFRILLVLQILI
ncbi:hypothetical protein CEXT_539561 [Caerostris extrusa]|uniref:Uncharacterized protein n=1 Tax=Caerostris extrusa TaxID=172846 RepID=A0AAV4TCJ7_CAEEX|nr:hypothetical protein CEXT_539561 [Caerostris extrusa]